MNHEPENSAQGPPVLSFEGDTASCGYDLGHAWAQTFRKKLAHVRRTTPWWTDAAVKPFVERYAPHLPALFEAMAKGAGLPVEKMVPLGPEFDDGCTSFSIAPSEACPGGLCGQTKDTSRSRMADYRLLRLRLSDAPSLLTLTYPGWIFGHGFVQGRCAIWRNSILTDGDDGPPRPVCALVAMHCPTATEAVEVLERLRPGGAAHLLVVDAEGGAVGLEFTRFGIDRLEPEQGLYVHANAVRANAQALGAECDRATFKRDDSLRRDARLPELIQAATEPLDAAAMMGLLADHDNHPVGLCRHQCDKAMTTAAIVAELSAGRLHVVIGPPCSHEAVTFSL